MTKRNIIKILKDHENINGINKDLFCKYWEYKDRKNSWSLTKNKDSFFFKYSSENMFIDKRERERDKKTSFVKIKYSINLSSRE